jgi:hypothetical protein
MASTVLLKHGKNDRIAVYRSHGDCGGILMKLLADIHMLLVLILSEITSGQINDSK